MSLLPESQRHNYIVSIFGMKGSGKSYLAKEIAAQEPRVIAIDNLGEYNSLSIVYGFRECVSALVAVENRANFRLALRTTSIEEDLALIDLVYNMKHVTLIAEETSRYVSPTYLPREFEQLVRYGRHRAINQIYLARRPSEIHRDLTAQSDVIVSFLQHEERDLKYLRSFMGDEAYRAANLPKYKFIIYGPDEKMPWPLVSRKYETP